jgi:hypothetical protein
MTKNEEIEHQVIPKIARVDGLTEVEIQVMDAIVHKAPSDTWEKIAGDLKISRRTLFAHRQNPRLQEALISITLDVLKTEILDVIKSLIAAAKSGNPAAGRILIEYADRSWNLEQQYNRKLNRLREAVLTALEKSSPETIMEISNELRRIELD